MRDTPKTYGEGCLVAHALDLVGDRWVMLVVRELMLGQKRFGAIKARIPGIATNMLTRRLEDLEAAGVLVRRRAPPPVSAQVYELTADGLALWPVIEALCHWGARVPGHDPTLPISPMALMLSMRANYGRRAAEAAGMRLSVGFDLGDESFAMQADGARLDLTRTDRPAGDVIFTAAPNDLAPAVYGPRPLADHLAAGRVALTGDLGRAQAFLDLFALRHAPA